MLRALLIALSVLASGVAMAQAGAGSQMSQVQQICRDNIGIDPSTQQSVPHSAEWLCATTTVIERANLFSIIDNLAMLVFLSFFVGRTLSISIGPNPGTKMRPFLLASFVGIGIMLSLTPIRSGMTTIWGGTYILATNINADLMSASFQNTADQLERSIPNLADTTALTTIASAMATIASASSTTAGQAAVPGRVLERAFLATGRSAVSVARMTPAAQILNAVLLPILTLYTVIVYGAALAMIIGMLFLPIGAIMFVAGGGAQFFTNWTNIMLASLLTLLLFPIMWAVTTQIAIITPVQSFVNQWETAASQFTDEMNAIAADSTQLTLTPDGVRKFVSEQFDAAWQRLSLTLQQGLNVIQLIFAIVVGLVAAFSLIFLLQTYIMKFIAGVIAAVAAFRPLLTFGGGGRSRASSTSTQNKTGDTTTRGGGGGDDGSSGGGDGGTPPRSTGPARARGGARAASASTGSPRPTAAAGGAGRATVQAPRTIDDGESDHIYAPSPDEVAKYSGRAGKRGS